MQPCHTCDPSFAGRWHVPPVELAVWLVSQAKLPDKLMPIAGAAPPPAAGPIFRQSPPILETTLDRLVKEVVLTRKFSSVRAPAQAEAGRAH